MNKASLFMFGAMLTLAAGSAHAENPASATAAATGATQATETPNESATSDETGFTETEVQQFATAVIAVQEIEKDAALPAADKQTQMAAAIEKSGLDIPRFNELAQASASDPALMQRVQAAAQAQATPAPAEQ